MTEARFIVPKRGKDCLNCDAHQFNNGVLCNHPLRPERPVQILRWGAGCPQHIPLKEPNK